MKIKTLRKLVYIRRAAEAFDNFFERIGDLVVHIGLNGRPGQVSFGVPDGADGEVHMRAVGRQPADTPLSFRIENRWLARRGGVNGEILNAVMTTALETGLSPAYVTWQGRRMMPYTVARLGVMRRPDDHVLPAETRWHPADMSVNHTKYDPLSRNSAVIQQY